MIPSIPTLVSVGALLFTLANAQYDPALVGTWSTKSKKVVTGPSFYNPVTDTLLEPELPGISYSFTQDGHYEEAYYRAISNPTQPACPQGLMQWQHGTYSLPGNGSIVLEPFAVDGRQLVSSPCTYDQAIYTRYSQAELMLRYEATLDTFHNVQRLNLFQFDGSPVNPMWLMYSPPQMLPTSTLNPTASSTGAAATGKSRVMKRDPEAEAEAQERLQHKTTQPVIQKPGPRHIFNPDRWWWVGIGLTGIGTAMYMMPTST